MYTCHGVRHDILCEDSSGGGRGWGNAAVCGRGVLIGGMGVCVVADWLVLPPKRLAGGAARSRQVAG